MPTPKIIHVQYDFSGKANKADNLTKVNTKCPLLKLRGCKHEPLFLFSFIFVCLWQLAAWFLFSTWCTQHSVCEWELLCSAEVLLNNVCSSVQTRVQDKADKVSLFDHPPHTLHKLFNHTVRTSSECISTIMITRSTLCFSTSKPAPNKVKLKSMNTCYVCCFSTSKPAPYKS